MGNLVTRVVKVEKIWCYGKAMSEEKKVVAAASFEGFGATPSEYLSWKEGQ